MSFGGPIAHLGYFRSEFVHRRKWLGDDAYADVVALSQFVPGPASSQTGFALGLLRGGLAGGAAAWAGFHASVRAPHARGGVWHRVRAKRRRARAHSWAEAARRRGRGAGRMEHGAQPVPRPPARRVRVPGRGGHDRGARRRPSSLRPSRRAAFSASFSRARPQMARPPRSARKSIAWRRRSR